MGAVANGVSIMPITHLTDRAILRLRGPDAEHFLQNLVTPDLGSLGDGAAKPGALLSPQGKILFDFLIARDGPDAFLLDCRSDIAADLAKRLALYKLRARIDISLEDQVVVTVSWDDDSGSSQNDSSGLLDKRFAGLAVRRRYGEVAPPIADDKEWHLLRARHAVAESGMDYMLGDAFPHDVLFDANGGVGLRKGCFVGQEVVSRMQHRGTARRRLLIARAETDLPEPGTEIVAGGRALGTTGTAVGHEGLAIARIDRVKAAMDSGQPIEAGGVTLSLSIPPWAGFGFPEPAAQGGSEE
jgi:tRNA-modifying protein YgfZ